MADLGITWGVSTSEDGLKYIITGRNEVLAKVIFLHLSVILFTGGAWWRTPPPRLDGGTPPRWRNPPWAGWRTPPWLDGGTPPRMDGEPPPLAGWRTPSPRLDGEPPPWEADSGIRSTIGRYASYWNAFLFGKMFAKNCKKMKEIGPRRGARLWRPEIRHCLQIMNDLNSKK